MNRRMGSLAGHDDGRREPAEEEWPLTTSELLAFAGEAVVLLGGGIIWIALCAAIAWRLAGWIAG